MTRTFNSGVIAVIRTDNPDDAEADGEEIEAIRWYSREQIAADIASGELLLPPGISIARRMIELW